MPRRSRPDSFSLEVGERIRDLRIEGGMTLEELADQTIAGSKGHISNIERGLVRPNIYTLKQVADGLGVKPLDLVTFPKKSLRERLIDLTRRLTRENLKHLAVLIANGLRSKRKKIEVAPPRLAMPQQAPKETGETRESGESAIAARSVNPSRPHGVP
jgi:transcriptional regulator with XRE-family HTH domain